MGPGVSGECIYKCGEHINEDMFIVEIIDPRTGEVLPYGESGEVVITTLTKEAMPVLRYRTRDISYIIPEPCTCGRTSCSGRKGFPDRFPQKQGTGSGTDLTGTWCTSGH